ncbi:hypothetical protein D1Y84_03375 [Acidipila sp. EB88]|nr:hypothetical protein D1Y84_03375 [Acidipila sp. EB88]
MLLIVTLGPASGDLLRGQSSPQAAPQGVPQVKSPPHDEAPSSPKPRISAAQARELFRSVDTILAFDARDTGFPVRQSVKRRLLTRDQVVAYLKQKMDEDKDTARIERSAITLEKFGLLPQHFSLRPFLLKLLGEQVAGFYDSKTRTVNLLDWLDADTQKPVLAHELTHALQDQYQASRHIDLDKWENTSPDGTAQNIDQDREHIRTDETDSAREAVLEGQAMVAYLDWGLEGKGQTLRTLPDFSLSSLDAAAGADDSPVLASAPLVMRQSLLFPYQEGLVFEQRLLKDRGTAGAFAEVLQRPPSTSWQILHPAGFEHGDPMPLLQMPDLHPLLDQDWAPYDVGVMGALDVRILAEQLGDKGAGADAALAWDGGVYYAAQSRSATTAAARDSTASIAMVYLSRWKTAAAAAAFARVYRDSLPKRYPGLRQEPHAAEGPAAVYATVEGPVIVDQRDRYVFVSHTLPVNAAEAVEARMLAAQTGAQTSAEAQRSEGDAAWAQAGHATGLTAPLRAFFAQQGMLSAGMPRVYCARRRGLLHPE